MIKTDTAPCRSVSHNELVRVLVPNSTFPQEAMVPLLINYDAYTDIRLRTAHHDETIVGDPGCFWMLHPPPEGTLHVCAAHNSGTKALLHSTGTCNSRYTSCCDTSCKANHNFKVPECSENSWASVCRQEVHDPQCFSFLPLAVMGCQSSHSYSWNSNG